MSFCYAQFDYYTPCVTLSEPPRRIGGEPMPLREAHKIAEVVHNSIEKTFPKVKHIMVHVNPKIDRK